MLFAWWENLNDLFTAVFMVNTLTMKLLKDLETSK